MSADTYQMISIIAFALAAVFFILAVILFFKFHIPSLINDLSGRTAMRQIQEIRERNSNDNKRKNVINAFEVSGDIGNKITTEKISRERIEATEIIEREEETELLHNQETEILRGTDKTEMLDDLCATELLDNRNNEKTQKNVFDTEKLKPASASVLDFNGGTQVLSQNDSVYEADLDITEELDNSREKIIPVSFEVIKTIKIVHTEIVRV